MLHFKWEATEATPLMLTPRIPRNTYHRHATTVFIMVCREHFRASSGPASVQRRRVGGGSAGIACLPGLGFALLIASRIVLVM